jgi:hypothetical protein
MSVVIDIASRRRTEFATVRPPGAGHRLPKNASLSEKVQYVAAHDPDSLVEIEEQIDDLVDDIQLATALRTAAQGLREVRLRLERLAISSQPPTPEPRSGASPSGKARQRKGTQ